MSRRRSDSGGFVDRRQAATIIEEFQIHQVIIASLALIGDVASHVMGRMRMQAEHDRKRGKDNPQATKTAM